MSSDELGYLHIEVRGKISWRCCVQRLTLNKLFMRTVQQNVFLILDRVPVTFVTDPELIRSLLLQNKPSSVKQCDCQASTVKIVRSACCGTAYFTGKAISQNVRLLGCVCKTKHVKSDNCA